MSDTVLLEYVAVYPKPGASPLRIMDAFGVAHTLKLREYVVIDANGCAQEFRAECCYVLHIGDRDYVQVKVEEWPAHDAPYSVRFPDGDVLPIRCDQIIIFEAQLPPSLLTSGAALG